MLAGTSKKLPYRLVTCIKVISSQSDDKTPIKTISTPIFMNSITFLLVNRSKHIDCALQLTGMVERYFELSFCGSTFWSRVKQIISQGVYQSLQFISHLINNESARRKWGIVSAVFFITFLLGTEFLILGRGRNLWQWCCVY